MVIIPEDRFQPPALLHQSVMAPYYLLVHSQDKGERCLRYRPGIGPRGIAYRDPPLGGTRNVYVVHPRPVFLDIQAFFRLSQHFGRNALGGGDQHLRAGQILLQYFFAAVAEYHLRLRRKILKAEFFGFGRDFICYQYHFFFHTHTPSFFFSYPVQGRPALSFIK